MKIIMENWWHSFNNITKYIASLYHQWSNYKILIPNTSDLFAESLV